MNTTYLVISRGQDEPNTYLLTEAELMKRLNDQGWWAGYTFLGELPNRGIDYFPEDSVFIFRGTVVVPKPVETVTQYAL